MADPAHSSHAVPGIYLHIPFCKQACHYCNFHFSTSLRSRDEMVAAIVRELDLRRDYLDAADISSIYFGGGTPSLLTLSDLERIFEKIHRIHKVLPDAEITLEANPDDLDADKLRDLRRHTPVNRLSIGIQSFREEDLKWMNRAHNAVDAQACLRAAATAGFDDLTIDLIYGAPTTTDAQWQENLSIAFDYGIPHLSCYCLTVEEGTALGTFVRKGQQPPVDEVKAARQFEYLLDATAGRGYEHYEISNFAQPGRYARHNSSYWSGEPYLGAGPSAHSFNGWSRQWNIANNALYMKALADGNIPFDIEMLTPVQRYNEYVMTALRTKWGVDRNRISAMGENFAGYFEQEVQRFLVNGTVEEAGGHYTLTRAGKLLADGIAAELFMVEPAA